MYEYFPILVVAGFILLISVLFIYKKKNLLCKKKL